MKLIAEGAEASVYTTEGKIIKKRHKKDYRIKELDDKLRRFRTKREAKVMERLKEDGVTVPKLISADEKNATIEAELIKGEKLRDCLSSANCKKICNEIGRATGKMHDANIIHGDLTTSNMILGSDERIYLVDFGLSLFSNKDEDKAVDLHLLRQALNSSHNTIAEKCFTAVINGYKKTNNKSGEILKRLEKVEERGRHKGKTGKAK